MNKRYLCNWKWNVEGRITMNSMIVKPKSISWCAVCPNDYSDVLKGVISPDSKLSVLKRISVSSGESLTFFIQFLNKGLDLNGEECGALLRKGIKP